jgi:hypothetical protein
MGRGLAIGLLVLLALAVPARGQTGGSPPPGSADYFGFPHDDKFTPNTLKFPAAEPPPPAAPLPSATGDGLFPEDPPPPEPPPKPKPWSGGGDIGLNGASGNSNLFNLRTNWHAQRKTPDNLFVTDFQYSYLTQESETEQQQAILNTRDEILFPGRPWSIFSAGQIEYDELRAYRFRVGEYVGLGYLLFDEKHKQLRVRAGAGASRELGVDGARNQWVPEAVFGYDKRYRIDERNAVVSVLDFYPRIDHQFGQFRVRTRTAYEVVLDPKRGTVIRLGIQDRYDSNPGNAFRNDLTYFATFGLKF